jgi:hypothetical protein
MRYDRTTGLPTTNGDPLRTISFPRNEPAPAMSPQKRDDWDEGDVSLPVISRAEPVTIRRELLADPDALAREPTFIYRYTDNISRLFYGPYRQVSRILPVPGYFIFLMPAPKNTCDGFHGGFQTEKSLVPILEKNIYELRQSHGLKLSIDYTILVRYHCPPLRAYCTDESAPDEFALIDGSLVDTEWAMLNRHNYEPGSWEEIQYKERERIFKIHIEAARYGLPD